MVRVAVRKSTTSKKGAKPASKVASISSRTTALKKSEEIRFATPILQNRYYTGKIQQYLRDIDTFFGQKNHQLTINQKTSKRWNELYKAISSELKKANCLNVKTTQCLSQINNLLKTVSNLPQAKKEMGIQLLKGFKNDIHQECHNFLLNLKGGVVAKREAFEKLENEMLTNVAKAKKAKWNCYVDTACKKKFETLYTQYKTLKSNFSKYLNKISLNGNAGLKTLIKGIKVEFDKIEKTIKRCITMNKRYAVSSVNGKSKNSQQIFTYSKARECETKMNHAKKGFPQMKSWFERYNDQLKAVKKY